jgi:predicted dehydrogenase
LLRIVEVVLRLVHRERVLALLHEGE